MNLDFRNRAPTVERLPDLRQRVTRVADVLNFVPKTQADILAKVWLPWGTQDTEYTTCRLVKQDVPGQSDAFPDTSKRPPTLVRVYEEIAATGETQVGGTNIEFDQYGNKIITIDTIQFSAGTSTFQVVGHAAAPAPNATAILKDESRTDDGTLQRIKRIYTTGGQLDQVDTLKFGGKVLVRRLKYLNQIPPTPAGFTLVEQSKYFVNGLPVYEYGYASAAGSTGAGGIIDQGTSYSQSIDEGMHGVTVINLSQVTDYSFIQNPISTPSGFVLISVRYSDDSGYRLWSATCAKGVGLVGVSDETKNNGALLMRTITALGTPITTLLGYTLISESDRNADGYVIYTTTFAKGTGEISRDVDWSQGASIGSETVGITRTTVRYLTTPGGIDPTDVSGSIQIGASVADQDGYEIHSSVWAKGIGEVSRTTDTKYNGALFTRNIRYLTAPGASEPTPSDMTDYIQISSGSQQSDGHVVWTLGYAKGVGEISREIDWSQGASASSEAIGVTRTTVRCLMAPGGTDSTDVSGSVKIGSSIAKQDGYEISTTVWGKGVGLVVDDVQKKNNGKLYLYHRIALGAPPSPPTHLGAGTALYEISSGVRKDSGYDIYDYNWAEGEGEVSREVNWSQGATQADETLGVTKTTIRYLVQPGGTVQPTSLSGSAKISEDVSEADGYRAWTTVWAKGAGVVVSDVSYQVGDSTTPKLIKYHKVSLGSAPAAPTPITAGGSVALVASATRQDSGYVVYDYSWVEGYGVIDKRVSPRDGGLRIELWTSLTPLSAGSALFVPPGVAMTIDQEFVDGAAKWTVACIQSNAGGNPLSGSMLAFYDYENFTYPGRAKLYTKVFAIWSSGTGYVHNLFKSPPVQIRVLANVEISYQASDTIGALTYPLWNPNEWATVRSNFQGVNAYAQSEIESLYGYMVAGTGVLSFHAPPYPSTVVVMGTNILQNSSGEIELSGGPSDPAGTTVTLIAKLEPAFVSYDGTQYYRKTIVTATIPTQPALPV